MMADEITLIRRSRERDERAFEQLVLLKREKAFRIALNILGNEEDARDVAQTAFIRLWSAIGGFDEAAAFDPWFSRIVVNLAIDFLRKRRQIPRALEEPIEEAAGGLLADVQPGAEDEAMRSELRRIFNRLAVKLAPAQRAVFTLKEVEGMSTEEIAGLLEIRPSTVRNHLMQARLILQEGLRRRYPEYFRGKRK